MDKEVVVQIYSGILAIKTNGTESVVVRWMDLESVIQSEISQKEKQILCIPAYFWNLEKWYM